VANLVFVISNVPFTAAQVTQQVFVAKMTSRVLKGLGVMVFVWWVVLCRKTGKRSIVVGRVRVVVGMFDDGGDVLV
jgi:hypothetical protein